MKNSLRYLTFFLIVGSAYGQSNLPACQGSDVSKWSNCYGSANYSNGDKYVGDFKNGQRWGLGTFTWPDGTKYIGQHEGDNLDTRNNTYIFPDGYTIKTVNGEKTHYPANKVDSKVQQSDNELTTRNSLNQAITKFCRGKPKVLLFVVENIAAKILENPNSINLERVEVVTESMRFIGMDVPQAGSQEAKDELYFGCNGVFYSPKGPLICNLHFYSDGVVANACDSTILGGIGDPNAITRTLTSTLKDLYWARVLPKKKPNNRPGQTCYDMATGRAITCKD